MSPVGVLGLFFSTGSLEHWAWSFQHGLWSTGVCLFSWSCSQLQPSGGCFQLWLRAANLKSGDFWYGPELAVVISVYGVTIVI